MEFIKRIQSQTGVSILEVLIALVITGILTAALMKVYVTQHQNYLIQDDITDVQQSARAAIDELARHIRMAGNALPEGIKAIEASNTNPDTITLTYRSDDCETFLSDPMPQPSAELKCGSDISCFEEGQWVYIYDIDSASGEWFEITEVQAAAYHIQHNTMTLSRSYDADALLLAMKQVKFFIDNTTDPDHPCLMVEIPGQTPQVFAENIVDLQFSYRLKNGMIVDVPVIADDIREVSIAVSGRSAHETYEDDTNEYRLRTYSSSVNVRNLGV